MPEEDLPDLFDGWLSALGSQLTSFPADLRIEQWVYDKFPGLRGVQERSLTADVQRAFPLFDPLVIASVPRTIWQPTMAMNAAQAWQVAMLYNKPELLDLFQKHSLGIPGRNLARMVLDEPDEGHRSDMVAVNQWAEELGLTGWFAWAPFEGSR